MVIMPFLECLQSVMGTFVMGTFSPEQSIQPAMPRHYLAGCHWLKFGVLDFKLLVFPTASWLGCECRWRETSQPWLCNLHLVFILTDTHTRDQFLTLNWIFMLYKLALLLSSLELVRHLSIPSNWTFAFPLLPHSEKYYWYFICPKARAWGLLHSLSLTVSRSLNRFTHQ